MNAGVNSLLSSAEDIVLISPAENKDNFVFAAKPDFATRKKYFEATLSNSSEREIPAFNAYWSLDEAAQEIHGSSTFLGLRLDKAMRPDGLWLPGILEAMVLDSRRKLDNYCYRDFGIAVYNGSDPHGALAQPLIERVTKEGWELPILVPFRSLDYSLNPNSEYGVDINFVDKPQGVLSEKEAEEVFRNIIWRGNSGVRRFGFNLANADLWNADFDYLSHSYDKGRIGDWVCGEASIGELKQNYNLCSSKECEREINESTAKHYARLREFRRELEGAG